MTRSLKLTLSPLHHNITVTVCLVSPTLSYRQRCVIKTKSKHRTTALTQYKATFEVQVNVERKLIKQGRGNGSAFLPYLSKAVHMNWTSDPKNFCQAPNRFWTATWSRSQTSVLLRCHFKIPHFAYVEYWQTVLLWERSTGSSVSAMTKFCVLYLQGLIISKSQGDTDGDSDTE